MSTSRMGFMAIGVFLQNAEILSSNLRRPPITSDSFQKDGIEGEISETNPKGLQETWYQRESVDIEL